MNLTGNKISYSNSRNTYVSARNSMTNSKN